MKYRLIASAVVIAVIGALTLASNPSSDAVQSATTSTATSSDDAAFSSFKK